MKNRLICLCLAALVLLPVSHWATEADTSRPAGQEQQEPQDTLEPQEYFVIETRHRLFPQFSQIDTVAMNETFYVGEEEWQATVTSFIPHLGITMEGEALQLSDTLYNPAVRVRVMVGDELKQETWGFKILSSPHFRRDDLLAFRLVEFKVSDKYIEAPPRK